MTKQPEKVKKRENTSTEIPNSNKEEENLKSLDSNPSYWNLKYWKFIFLSHQINDFSRNDNHFAWRSTFELFLRPLVIHDDFFDFRYG